MTNAIVVVHDCCLGSHHGQHVSLRTNRGTSGATNALSVINLWMLGVRPFGKQLSLFHRGAGALVSLLQTFEIESQEKESDNSSYDQGDEGVHITCNPSS